MQDSALASLCRCLSRKAKQAYLGCSVAYVHSEIPPDIQAFWGQQMQHAGVIHIELMTSMLRLVMIMFMICDVICACMRIHVTWYSIANNVEPGVE